MMQSGHTVCVQGRQSHSFRKFIFAVAAAVSAFILAVCVYAEIKLPDELYLVDGAGEAGLKKYQLSLSVSEAAKPVSVNSQTGACSGKAEYMLFGFIPVKSVTTHAVEKKNVVLCGTPFGVKVFTNGVMVVGMTDVDTSDGNINPARQAGIRESDVIFSINGVSVNSNRQIAAIIEALDGSSAVFEIDRDGTRLSVELIPAYSKTAGCYKAGLWVRDSSAGIGTMTYYEPETLIFAALGHGICDVDTGELLPLKEGEIVGAQITSILKGTAGSPGELCGYFKETGTLGSLKSNSDIGIYGVLNNAPSDGMLVQTAVKQEISKGEAQILSSVSSSGIPKLYRIEIERISYKSGSAQKNMVIRVTDEELLAATGGIVQGMSGSPIIQNGKFIGAVTHVFVNDPTRGYAIFAENMLCCTAEANETKLTRKIAS